MLDIKVDVDESHVNAHFDQIGPDVKQALLTLSAEIAREIEDAARGFAIAHFHSVGAKPGLYLAGFKSGTYDKQSRVGGWVNNANPLAHLLEYGFTISEMTITAANLMAFEGDAGTVFAKYVHRPETEVPAYPALHPAFDEAKAAIGPRLAAAGREAARK